MTDEIIEVDQKPRLERAGDTLNVHMPSSLDQVGIEAFFDAMADLEADRACAMVVFHLLPANFHGEVGQIAPSLATLQPGEGLRAFVRLEKALGILTRLEKPTALVIGGCPGPIGLDLAMVTDLRIGRDDTTFMSNTLRLGVLPGMTLYRLVRHTSLHMAKQIVLHGARIGAHKAQGHGLLDYIVVDPLALLPSMVTKLREVPPFVLSLARRLINEAEVQDYDKAFESYKAAQYHSLDHSRRKTEP